TGPARATGSTPGASVEAAAADPAGAALASAVVGHGDLGKREASQVEDATAVGAGGALPARSAWADSAACTVGAVGANGRVPARDGEARERDGRAGGDRQHPIAQAGGLDHRTGR